jgi:hypothetical protein
MTKSVNIYRLIRILYSTLSAARMDGGVAVGFQEVESRKFTGIGVTYVCQL